MRRALLLVTLVACGKGKRGLDDYLPEKLGRFARSGPVEWTEREKDSRIYADRRDARKNYKAGSDELSLEITSFDDEAAAKNYFAQLIGCPPYSEPKPQPIETKELVGKDGRSVQVYVCGSQAAFWDQAVYLVGVRNGTDLIATNLTPDLGAAVELVKAVPPLAGIDLAMLDARVAKTPKPGKQVTFEMLKASNPPVKLADQPYIKGKVWSFYGGGDNANWMIADKLLAKTSSNEIGTVVKLACERGSRIANYTDKELKFTVPMYSSHCNLEVIDLTIPAVIAKKQFINVALPDTLRVPMENGKPRPGSDGEAGAPVGEIRTFLEGLPIKSLGT